MITIVPMTKAHAEAVHDIESHSFSDPWPIEDILFELAQAHTISYVAMVQGVVAGFGSMRHIVNEGHISNIATHEDYRKNGVASAIVAALIQSALSMDMIGITLEVRIGNRAAMALYHKYGFVVEGYRRGYYNHPREDAAIMWKYLQ